MSRPLPRTETRLSGIAPLSAPRSLTQELMSRLAADITSGKLAPGSQLPTEQELIAATGVSRTVVREAVAQLRAEGLVVTRQGVGAFVVENPRRPFRLDVSDLQSLHEVIEVMELRTGIEIEAAGLAAERASAAQVKTISAHVDAIGAAVARGETGVDEDFNFHCSIADATGNPQFRKFLEYLGRFIIPRDTIRGGPAWKSAKIYSQTFQKEHRQIVRAIREGAVAQARAAMRQHLLNSRKRYKKLASKIGE